MRVLTENKYFTVTKSFTLFVIQKFEPSNTWVGQANILQPVYIVVEVDPGQQLHRLVGGNFLAMSIGQGIEVFSRRLEASEILLRPTLPKGPEPPADCLQEIPKEDAFEIHKYRRSLL